MVLDVPMDVANVLEATKRVGANQRLFEMQLRQVGQQCLLWGKRRKIKTPKFQNNQSILERYFILGTYNI